MALALSCQVSLKEAAAKNTLKTTLDVSKKGVKIIMIIIMGWFERTLKHVYYHSPGLMHETEGSGLVHWDDPEGWDGEAWEGGSDGEHMYAHGRFMSTYGKNHYNIVISLQLK